MRTIFPIMLAIAACIASGQASQAPADFSGRWTVAPAAPATGGAAAGNARGDMGSGWGTTITITQDANQLVVETLFYSRYDLQPQPRFVYALDGSESRNTVITGRGPQMQSSHAIWQGTTLSLSTVHTFADPASGKLLTTEIVQKLSLESPATLVVEVARPGVLGGQPSTTRTVYLKGG